MSAVLAVCVLACASGSNAEHKAAKPPGPTDASSSRSPDARPPRPTSDGAPSFRPASLDGLDETSFARWRASARLPPFAPQPPASGADRIVYRGRVLASGGPPVDGAHVRLVGMQMQGFSVERPPFVVWGAVLTDAEGNFELTVPTGVRSTMDYLVVEGMGVSRTLYFDEPPRPTEVWLSPERTVRVELECGELFEDEMDAFPYLVGTWHRRVAAQRTVEDPWTERALIPDGIEWPAPTLPGHEPSSAPTPDDARRFAADITLPAGERSTLTIDGPCGVARREVEIPATGPVPPIRFALPDPSAAAIELRLTGSEPARPWSVPFTYVWSDDHETTLDLHTAETTAARGIPPGTYRVGDRNQRQCQRTVVLRPGATTRVELDPASCLVLTRRLPHDLVIH